MARTWRVLDSFIRYATGVSWDNIYRRNEYHYLINKFSELFNRKLHAYMHDRLHRLDEQLDHVVEDLVSQELGLNLIKASDYATRFAEVKRFVVKYYAAQNARNLPRFTLRLFMRVCYVTIMTLMQKMFPRGIWCNRGEFLGLYRRYLDDPMLIVFLPNHQLHIDYIILHLVAIRFQLLTPTVIAGENLNVAVFGAILKGLGAIFIKRLFNNERYTERNLSNYVEFTLLNKVHFEVFIEGTRLRDGKLLLPKYGILKMLANIFLKQRDEGNDAFDVLMQPVSITYERIYEADGYLRELMGRDKQQESGLLILKNGLKHLVGRADVGASRHLHGKIFLKLGRAQRLSEFVAADLALATAPLEVSGCKVNLKKLGFLVLHEINRCLYVPEIALIGSALQTHCNLHRRATFEVAQLVPLMRFIVESFLEQDSEQHVHNQTNARLWRNLQGYSDRELIQLVKEQVPQFFREVSIDATNTVTVASPIELLYYKNLTIHLVVHRSLACFLLLSVPDAMRTNAVLHRLYYVFTAFLKSEFLFDYDYNDQHKLLSILKALVRHGRIERVGSGGAAAYRVADRHYLHCFGEIIKPFLEAYQLCIRHITETVLQFTRERGLVDFKQLLIGDDEEYPHTKLVLRAIQRGGASGGAAGGASGNASGVTHIESTNKQYLLLCLYYLNNLQLIDIVKNKRRTKAYVVVTNDRDLAFVHRFLEALLGGNARGVTDSSVAYMIDIIDKNFERDAAAPADGAASAASATLLKAKM